MTTKVRCPVRPFLLVSLALAVPALAQPYEVVPLGSLGGTYTRAQGVNDAAVVVGVSSTTDETNMPFVWESGAMRQLPLLMGGTTGEATGVNASGVIVGRSNDASGQDRAVRWTRNVDGSWSVEDLGTLGGTFARASAINDRGQVTGASQIAPPPPPQRQSSHAFLLDTSMSDLGVLRFSDPNAIVFSEGTALNAMGHVVGFSYPVLSAELDHAFYFDGATMIDLTPRGFRPRMRANGINDGDVIVGEVADRDLTGGPSRAFFMSPGDATPQFVPTLAGHTDNAAYAIGNDGAIVGTSYSTAPDGGQRAFLFTRDGVFDLNSLAGNPTPAVSEATAISPGGLIAGVVSTPLGVAGVLLRPDTRCVADVDDGTGTGTPDRGVTIDDLLYYIAIFADGVPAADIDNGTSTGTPDGGVTIDDLLYYLLRFDAGC
jgi:probable HAF family extracellular repeat protein